MTKKKRGSYDTKLKKDANGYFRWLGKDKKGTRQQFRLGKNKSIAERRMSLILVLFQHQSDAARFYDCDWVPEFLKSAKQIAKGKKAVLPRLKLYVNESDYMEQSPETYMKLLLVLNRNGILFEPDDDRHMNEAIESISNRQTEDRQFKSKLAGTNPAQNPTGQILIDAIESFKEATKKKFTKEGILTAWGQKKIDSMNSVVAYVKLRPSESATDLLNLDLADVTLTQCQEILDSVRNRPLSIRSGFKRRLKPSSVENFKKVLNDFWSWLDLSEEWDWTYPKKFRKLETKTEGLSEDEVYQEKRLREEWEITEDEIKLLFQCCTSVERPLLLLGLNCAFGAAEIGGLRKSFVKFQTSEIDGIRFKTNNSSRHKIWPETAKALQYELNRRKTLPQLDEHSEVVFLNEDGERLWRRVNGGYRNGVAKRWNCLRERVTKDEPLFRQFGFSRLRKTAAIRMLRIADAEAASLILAHGVPSDDKLLKNYISIPWEKLYEAQEEYRKQIRHLITTEHDPFSPMPKTYIGREKRRRTLELKANGWTARSIAQELEINESTVYRYIKDAM